MKMRTFLVGVAVLSLGLLTACESQTTQDPQQKITAELFKLARLNGCMDCHRVNATVVGPSWKAIAERYKDAPLEEARRILIERVKYGSKGNWATWKGGDGMPPMEKRVPADTIETLVDYILSFNTHQST